MPDMTTSLDQRILGVWSFDPARADYGTQPPPTYGLYTILPDSDGSLWFHVRATTGAGQRVETSFRAVPDGLAQPIPGGEQQLVTTVGDGTLTTVVLDDGLPVHTAERRLVVREDAADELHIVQELTAPDRSVLRTESVYTRARVKQVMCYRRDLKMRKGKIAAQCAHASMAVFFQRDAGQVDELSVPLDGPMAHWAKGRFGKVVLSVNTEEDLLTVHREAKARGIPSALITDAGLTEFGGVPTRTAVAIGPAVASEIDAITGPEGLVKTKLA